MKRIAGPVLALALAACGGPGAATPTPSVSGTNGPFHAVASPAQLAAGGAVRLTLTVTGPIQYQATCAQPLRIWAEDSRQRTIWSEPVVAISCAVASPSPNTLAAGETATFEDGWPTSPALAPGLYTLHGLFWTVLPPGAGMRVRENLPPLTIQISG